MGDTRWLDPDQQRDWRTFVNGIARLTDKLDRVLRDKHGLSMPEYEILVRLSEAERRRQRMADLAESVSEYFVDVIDPIDLVAIGRAFRSVTTRLEGD